MRRSFATLLATCSLALPSAFLAPHAAAQENQRSSLQVTTDEDGDVAVVMDTESIRMTVVPAYQACISSFIFKPTGNDILSRQSIKMTQAGSGLLQDNFWEQDWRFSEFRHKWYDFKIVSQGPDELAASFWCTSEGWLQADESGIKSDLISNILIERTIRMPLGKPYFLCDVNLSIDMDAKDEDGSAKLPQFWVHNMSIFTDDLSDEYQRPHVLGIAEQTPRGKTVTSDFVYSPEMAKGWSAHTSPLTKEGIVYLMDPSYVQSLYNCGNTTLEWFADNMLITRNRPLKTRIYILPVIGLDKVHFADPHMILKLNPKVLTEGPDSGAVQLDFSVLPSYQQVKSITFETTMTHGLHERIPVQARMEEPMPSVRNLRVEKPQHTSGMIRRADGLAITPQMPLLFDIVAHVEMVTTDGKLVRKDVKFQYFHLGAYPTGRNEHLQGGEPLAIMDRVDARPWIPTPDQSLAVDREHFKVFGLLGLHAEHYRIPEAIGRVVGPDGAPIAWDREADAGYSVGYVANTNGLSNFPYDFERLFGYRVMVNCNTQSDITRLVGQSIVASYLLRGGGYVTFGGESAYCVPPPRGHALNVFEPLVPREKSVVLPKADPKTPVKAAQLVVLEPNHPIFKGNGKAAKAIDLSHLPQSLAWHDLALKHSTGKPLLRDPNEPIMVATTGLPAETIAALQALPPTRRKTRAETAAALYDSLEPEWRAVLDTAIKKVFAKLPADALQAGVFKRAYLDQVGDEHKLDLREAFLDAGDNVKDTLNAWIDTNFARPTTVYGATLSEPLQQAVGQLLARAATQGDGVFMQDGDAWLLPTALHEELGSLLILNVDELPRTAQPKVLMELVTPEGKHLPFLVETVPFQVDPKDPTKLLPDNERGRALAFLNTPFGEVSHYPAGTVPYWAWDQWEQLVANAIMYAGRDL